MNRKALLCVMGLTAVPAVADNAVGHWYITPQLGGIWTDDDRGIEDEEGLYGLSIGKHLSPAWSLELNLNTASFDLVPGQNLDMSAASLDVLRVFRRGAPVAPYISVGVGAIQNDLSPGPKLDESFMAQAGLGLMLNLWENANGSRTFGMRPEVKARWEDVGSAGHFTDYIATVGFQFSFGPGRAAPPPMPAPAPQPQPEPVTQPAPPPPPVPADSDQDGVLDDQDRCPGTARGVAVDETGCPQRGAIILEGVTFETNSDQLTHASHAVLDRVAEGLRKYPRLRIELQGHTDSTGSDAYNLNLSQRRAESVRDYLIRRGVPASQLEARGYGESQPIASNATAEGRALNRRVVMNVLENPGDVEVKGEGEL